MTGLHTVRSHPRRNPVRHVDFGTPPHRQLADAYWTDERLADECAKALRDTLDELTLADCDPRHMGML